MHEWCRDVMDGSYCARSPAFEPVREREPEDTADLLRVVRGGSFKKDSRWARSSFRVALLPDVDGPDIGLRPVRRLEP